MILLSIQHPIYCKAWIILSQKFLKKWGDIHSKMMWHMTLSTYSKHIDIFIVYNQPALFLLSKRNKNIPSMEDNTCWIYFRSSSNLTMLFCTFYMWSLKSQSIFQLNFIYPFTPITDRSSEKVNSQYVSVL